MANATPAITFRANLTPKGTEQVGPDTLHQDPAMVNGDVFPDGADLANTLNAYRCHNIVTYLPGRGGAGGRELHHGDTFTAYGEEAYYLKHAYGVGVSGVPLDRQWLDIVTEA